MGTSCGVLSVFVPVGGRDYPRTVGEFNAWFVDEDACLAYLARLRWPGGFVCAACGGRQAWRLARRRKWRCAGCRLETSVTAGTIFADSHIPLPSWFAACWYVTSQKPGASALGLQRALGLGSYRSAWSMLQKLRRAMVRPERELLSGEIEVDETYVGGPKGRGSGRGTPGKTIIAIAVEARPGGRSGRLRLARIRDVSEPTLTAFVADAVLPGSVIYTDGWQGYRGLGEAGYIHQPISLAASGDPAHVVMPRAHRVASLLKRWLLGTHQGAVRAHQLDFYLDEYVFRFNRRTSRHRGLLFYRLLEQAMQIDPVPIRQLVGGRP